MPRALEQAEAKFSPKQQATIPEPPQLTRPTAALTQQTQAPAPQQILSSRQPIAPQELPTLLAPQVSSLSDQVVARSESNASPAIQAPVSFTKVSVAQDRSAPQKQSVRVANVSAGPIQNAATTAIPVQVTDVQPIRMKADDDAAQPTRQPAGEPQHTSVSGSLVQAEIDSVVNNRTQAISLAPRSENVAFSLKLVQNGGSAPHAPLHAQSAAPVRNEAPTSATGDTRPTVLPPAGRASHEPMIAKAEAQAAAHTTTPIWNESNVVANIVPRAGIQFAEQSPSPRTAATTAAHEVAVLPPEAPRPSVTNEILLQLGGKDQPATVRVLDRAGTVNVSVHAADPDVRASLRSNLGDLASQLSHQGWKTEVVKTGAVLTQGEPPRDSHTSGHRSPNQHQSSSDGERQPQKDRRGNGGQWLSQFEESLTQNSSNSGGSN